MNSERMERMTARQAEIAIGELPPGPQNAITDVKDVRVGHRTLINGNTNTGVTVILPHQKDADRTLYFWGKHVINCRNPFTGIQVLEDFGQMSAPVFLTNMTAVGRVYNGGITFGYSRAKGLPTDGGWPPIVMGIDDRVLNDLRTPSITDRHALEAIANVSTGIVEQGSVGAGTGAVAFGFKGGIGTSSRRIQLKDHVYHVGLLTLANHGRREELIITGVPVGKQMQDPPPSVNHFRSVVGVAATDAPIMPRQLNHLAARAAMGLMRMGGLIDPDESGLVVSFSTGIQLKTPKKTKEYVLDFIPDSEADLLYQAAFEAAEESVLNALFKSSTLKGREGRSAPAFPVGRIQQILQQLNHWDEQP